MPQVVEIKCKSSPPGIIIQSFGFDAETTALYSAAPGSIMIISNILVGLLVTRFRYKFPFLIILNCLALASAIALYVLPRTTEARGSLLAVFYVYQFYGACTGLIFYWSVANVAGHTKKACTTGMLYLGVTSGNIVGPQLYLKSEGESLFSSRPQQIRSSLHPTPRLPAQNFSIPHVESQMSESRSPLVPYYHTGLISNIVALVVLLILTVIQTLYLHHLNVRNVIRRRDRGKTGALIDMSLEPSSRWATLRARQVAQDEAEGKDPQYSLAFLDMTDLENEDLLYSL